MRNLNALVESAPRNLHIIETIYKAHANLDRHLKCAISVSGGSDSDIVMDLIELVKPDSCERVYVFFDTGLEYAATKRHLDELEQKYGVSIIHRKPRKTIPVVCREYGVPFICKDVSDVMNRLQRHSFDWLDQPQNATEEKYGRCKSALDWYFSRRPLSNGGKSRHDINRFKLLREFIMVNAPGFAISDKCCDYAKKQTAEDFNKEYRPDLVINGMRQAEGGRRAGSLQTCFSPRTDKNPDNYRPLWYWTDEDKAIYKEWRGIRYSDCYEVYGLKRTGCVGCPCNSKAEQELTMVEPFEPQIIRAARSVFGASYDYKRQYVEFKSKK